MYSAPQGWTEKWTQIPSQVPFTTLWFVLIGDPACQSSLSESEDKEMEAQIHISRNMHSLSCTVENLKSILSYWVTDVATYQENWGDAIHCVFKETFWGWEVYKPRISISTK